MQTKQILRTAVVVALLAPTVALADPVAVGNFSFETPLNPDVDGRFAQQRVTDVWEEVDLAGVSELFGFGFLEITASDGLQVASLARAASLAQTLDGAPVDGVTKSLVALGDLEAGDEITLTVGVGIRDQPNIVWADSAYFGLYDSATFDVEDPLNTALATSGFLPEPATRGVMTDTALTYTVTGAETGALGIYLRGEHLGEITGASISNHQAFFDNVRLDVPGGGTTLVPGDVDLDGDVDFTDFGFVRDNFLNTGATRTDGDLNGDGVVNFVDFQEIVDNFPGPPPAGGFASLLNPISTPEPGGLLIATLVGALWLARGGGVRS